MTGTDSHNNNIFSKHKVSCALWIVIKQLRWHIYRKPQTEIQLCAVVMICQTIISQAFVSLYLKVYKLMGRAHLQETDETGSSSVFTKLRSGFVSENLTPRTVQTQVKFLSKTQSEVEEGQLAWSQWLHI